MRITGADDLIPVGVLTGFLGSGKTTVLRDILQAEEFGDSAVLINEFGEVGLDHILVGEIAPDVVLLNSGCLCCTLRGELRDALADLLTRRTRGGDIPPFRRVVIETTGIAQPSLILSTVFADPLIRHHFGIGRVVCTVDALNAPAQSREHEVWTDQVTAADTLLITKSDLAGPEDTATVRALLETVNPTAHLLFPDDPAVRDLFFPVPDQNNPARQTGYTGTDIVGRSGDVHASVATLRISEETPLDWEAFGVWLSMLLHAHGRDIMRVKGWLRLEGGSGPVIIQGVNHVIYPPKHLEDWGDLPPGTELVFIVRKLDPGRLLDSFRVFVTPDSRKTTVTTAQNL